MTTATAQSSSSLFLTGVTSYAATPDAPVFDFRGSFTIELQFQSSAPHTGCLIAKFRQNSGTPLDDSYYILARADDTLEVRIQTSLQLIDLRARGTLHDSQWHHVALVLDTTAQIAELYLDGVLIDSQQAFGVLRDTNEAVRLGALLSGGGGGNLVDFFDGRIDELRFWNTARRGQQASCLREVTLLYDTPGLVSYYRFDEGTGNLAADQVPPYETFSLISGAVFSPVEPALRSRLAGPGQCVCGNVAGRFTLSDPAVTLVGDTITVPLSDSLILESHALTIDSTVVLVDIRGAFQSTGDAADSSFLLGQDSARPNGTLHFASADTVRMDYTVVSGFANRPLVFDAPAVISRSSFAGNPGGVLTGRALAISASRFSGNGLAITVDSANVTIGGCEFTNNAGALAATNSRVKIDSSSFNGNSVAGAGGALRLRSQFSGAANADSVTIRRTAFTANSADSGGAVWATNVKLLLEHCGFDSNAADIAGAAGISAEPGFLSRLVTDSSTFTNNRGGDASALLLAGIPGGAAVETRITHSTFAGNTRDAAASGSALRMRGLRAINGTGPVLERCVFHDNNNNGGEAAAVHVESLFSSAPAELRNLTVVLNNADSSAVRISAPAILRNSIAIENGGARQISGFLPAVAWCLTSDANYHGAGGSFYANPEFADFWNRDFRLTAGSAAINRGDPNMQYNDADGTRADAGAFMAADFAPPLDALRDVPHDNGRQLMLEWLPSAGDDARQGIASYSIYRRVDLPVLENYELVATVPAARLPGYGRIVPTLADSTAAGIPYFAYFVRAQSVNPLAFWDSPLDSAYSVNNLVPAAPANLSGLVVPAGVRLTWDAAPDSDVVYYEIYRAAGVFDPDTATIVYAVAAATVLDDTVSAGIYSYAVRAVDHGGNRSAPSAVATVAIGSLDAPQGLTLAAAGGSVELRWQAVPGAARYRIFRSQSLGGPEELAGTTTATVFVLPATSARGFFYVIAASD